MNQYGPQNPGGMYDIAGNAAELAEDATMGIVQCGGHCQCTEAQVGNLARLPFTISKHPNMGFRCIAHIPDYEQAVSRGIVFEALDSAKHE